ncbi:MAG: acyltransferase family protein [Gammaproteobacteria bacterium]|nr:acyltransferase family protein [Gammaproteobacteria bacterium]
MSELSKSSHYQPDIQGLRALAVVLVIIYHSGLPGLTGGYIGVDVFFVISGYVITSLLLRELDRSGGVSLTRFYARRMRRLLPAATLVLIATIAFAWFIYSPLQLKIFSSSAFATSIYLSNIWFAHLSTDYLAEDTGANPLLHTWSLGVEEQFYLAWPLLLLFAYRSGRGNSDRRLYTVFGLLTASSLLLAYWLTGYNQPWAFFSSPTRAWEFGVGGLTALWFARGASLGPTAARIASWGGLALVLLAATIFDRKTPFPGLAACLPVAGTALLIAAAHSDRLRGVNVLLATRPMQLVGDMSYSLYLWHWPVFVFFAARGGEFDLLRSLINIAIVFALSYATLVLVENPIRFNRQFSAKSTLSLAFGALLTASSASLAFGIRGIAATNLQSPQQRTFLTARDDIPRIYAEGCHIDQISTAAKNCVYGTRDGDFTAVLFGDSHAAHWFPPLERIAEERGWRLVSATKSGCPSVIYEPYNERFGRAYTECTEWRENVLRALASDRPELVIVSNIYTHTESTEDWQRGTSELLDQLAEISNRVVVIKDVPHPYRSIPTCLSQAAWLGKDSDDHCRVRTEDAAADAIHVAEVAAAKGRPNVSVVDLSDSICPASPCLSYVDGVIKYSDGNHLTATFSRGLQRTLEKRLAVD